MPKIKPKVVDLGTKQGGALGVFLKHGQMYFDTFGIKPGDCLGIDRKRTYEKAVRKRGYHFKEANIFSDEFVWPKADYYLAFDFLEHLPDIHASDQVLRRMIENARRGVWLRMPSFEQDEETGEGQLKKLGLRWAWTTWRGHPSHYLKGQACSIIQTSLPQRMFRMKVRPNRIMANTSDRSIVPIDAPGEANRFDQKTMGRKPHRKLDPPVVGQWEVIVNRK